jgi:hypothetical protein
VDAAVKEQFARTMEDLLRNASTTLLAFVAITRAGAVSAVPLKMKCESLTLGLETRNPPTPIEQDAVVVKVTPVTEAEALIFRLRRACAHTMETPMSVVPGAAGTMVTSDAAAVLLTLSKMREFAAAGTVIEAPRTDDVVMTNDRSVIITHHSRFIGQIFLTVIRVALFAILKSYYEIVSPDEQSSLSKSSKRTRGSPASP